MKSEETIFVLSNENNYYVKIKCTNNDIYKSYSNLINFYVSYSIENMNIKDKEIFFTGINVIHHIFRMMILYTKNLELSFYNTQQAIYFYVEYISQITDRDDNIFFNLSIKDAVIYVYTRTIFEIRKQYRKKPTSQDNETLSEFTIYSHNYLKLIRIISQYLFDEPIGNIKNILIQLHEIFTNLPITVNLLDKLTSVKSYNDCLEYIKSLN